MTTRMPLILIMALAAALITAGCGDDDEEPTTTTTEAATGTTGATGAEGASSEFAQQADEICREGNQEIDDAARERFGDAQGQEPSQEEQLSFAEEVVIPSVEQQIDEVTALTPPEGEEDTFEEFSEQAASDLEEVKADPSVLLERGGGEDPFAETNQLARELGLQVCGQG
jgi:hypothetical protein